MKLCTKCEELLPFDSFSWKSKPKGLLAPECKKCHSVMRKEYYRVFGQAEKDAIYSRRRENRKWLKEIRHSLSCEGCGETHPATLDFHHRDQSDKVIEISKAINGRGWSRDRILSEIEKCAVLCSNCHRKMHWDEELKRLNFNAA